MRCRRQRRLPPANTRRLELALQDLWALLPATTKETKGIEMSSPTGQVQVAQADLDNFASEISSAVAVLAPYIQQLLAGQSVQLAAGDETAVQAAVTSLQNLEPPAPTP